MQAPRRDLTDSPGTVSAADNNQQIGIGLGCLPEEVTNDLKDYSLKRPLDIILALIGFVAAVPVFLVVVVAVRLEDMGAIFYSQERVGKDGKLYRLWKFRTMIEAAEKQTGPVRAMEEDPRVTRVGKLLRKTALDEVPQLWNILIGDMSFVGPRSFRMHFVEQFSREVVGYSLRHIVTPGLTGLAQLYGSKSLSPRQMLRLDMLYVKNRSFRLDLKLIAASFWVTAKGGWENHSRKI